MRRMPRRRCCSDEAALIEPAFEHATSRFRLEIHDELGSTNDLCIARARSGEPDGLAVLARRQRAGRGRFGRAWQAPSGNLNLSVLLRPRATFGAGQAASGWLALLVAVALWRTVADALGGSAGLLIKWPNDLLLDAGKLAGVLIEAGETGGAKRNDWIVVGIGVNITNAPLLAERRTACLAERITPPAPEMLAGALLGELAKALASFEAGGGAALREAWLAAAHPVGSTLHVSLGDGVSIEGRFAGLAEDGALLLDRGNAIEAIRSGDVLLA